MTIVPTNIESPAQPVFLVDPSGNLYTAGPVALPDGVDRSSSIVTASAAQMVAPANPIRVGMTFQNTSTAVMRLTENGQDATATTGFLVNPNISVNIATNKSISVFCATAGSTFASTEF